MIHTRELFSGLLFGRSFCLFVFTSFGFRVGLHGNDLNGATSGLNFCASAGREFMSVHGKRSIDLAIAEDFDEATAFGGSHETFLDHKFGLDLRASLEIRKIYNIQDSIFIAEGEGITCRPHTAQERQALGEACLTAIERAINAAAGASFLTFGTATSSFAATGAMPTTDASFRFTRPGSGPQIGEFDRTHSTISSTCTRCATLRIMPRIVGTSSRSTVCWS